METKTEIEQRIIEAAKPDLYAADIAANLSLDVQHVYRTVRKYGLTIKTFSQGLTYDQQQTVIRMASPETGVRHIARVIGSTDRKVDIFMTKFNLPRKRQKEQSQPVKSGKDVFCWEDYENRLY
jgi:hypothetical protein